MSLLPHALFGPKYLNRNITVSVLILVGWMVCQLFRPAFFLTDDNLMWFLPHLTEAWSRIVHLQNPFISEIAGGNYSLIGDPTAISLFNPIIFLSGVLTLTPWKWYSIDVAMLLFMLQGAYGMLYLSDVLAVRRAHCWSTGIKLFIAISYPASICCLTLGSSWISYAIMMAALPWFIGGCCDRNAFRGGLFGVLAGIFLATVNPQAVLTVALLLCGFVVVGRITKSVAIMPCLVSVGAMFAVTLILLLPVLWGGGNGERLHVAGWTQGGQIPIRDTFLGLFNMVLVMGAAPTPIFSNNICGFTSSMLGLFALAATAVALRRGHSGPFFFAAILLFASALAFACRDQLPVVAVADIPILSAFRWPFRDALILVFSLHLVVLTVGRVRLTYGLAACIPLSIALYLSSGAFVVNGLSINPMVTNRAIVLSGLGEQIASDIRNEMEVDGAVVGIASPGMSEPEVVLMSRALMLMYGFRMASAYPPTKSIDPELPWANSVFRGEYLRCDPPASVRIQKNLTTISVMAINPLTIVINGKRGQVIKSYNVTDYARPPRLPAYR